MEGRKTQHTEVVIGASQGRGKFWEIGSKSFEGYIVDKS
jgi:hypothetical protein